MPKHHNTKTCRDVGEVSGQLHTSVAFSPVYTKFVSSGFLNRLVLQAAGTWCSTHSLVSAANACLTCFALTCVFNEYEDTTSVDRALLYISVVSDFTTINLSL